MGVRNPGQRLPLRQWLASKIGMDANGDGFAALWEGVADVAEQVGNGRTDDDVREELYKTACDDLHRARVIVEATGGGVGRALRASAQASDADVQESNVAAVDVALSAHEQACADALNTFYTTRVAEYTMVKEFRDGVLGGVLLSRDAVQEWAASASPEQRSTLASVVEVVAHDCEWQPDAAEVWLLTGNIPPMDSLRVGWQALGTRFHAGTNGVIRLFSVSIAVSAWVSEDTVRKAWKAARADLPPFAGVGKLAPRTLAVFRFVTERHGSSVMGAPWQSLVDEWNERDEVRVQGWTYNTLGKGDRSNFAKAYWRVRDALIHPDDELLPAQARADAEGI